MSHGHPTQPDQVLDLRGTPCPLNFIRSKLHLAQMPEGSLLEVWLDGGEPLEQVPDSLTMAGYRIAQVEERSGFYAVQVWQSQGESDRDESC